eukprot:TRINITY_DN10721_c0_g1_i1.p1 TRINITY_DN10721_c0_g1~~TRINITY_DN10721_c0_g1_i1.p1  ORF type:complete len:326 (+),score=27.02 TRINITY_DN10721_c0_g1_i1:47-1024(+)
MDRKEHLSSPIFPMPEGALASTVSDPYIPYDMWMNHIFSEFDFEQVARFSMVNKTWAFWAWEGLTSLGSTHWIPIPSERLIVLKKVAGRSRHHKLRNFKKISLQSLDEMRGAPKLLDRIASICVSIEDICLPRCNALTGRQVSTFLESFRLKKLELWYTKKDIAKAILGAKLDFLEELELCNVDLDPDFPRRTFAGLKKFTLVVPQNVSRTFKSVHFSEEAMQKYWISLCNASAQTLERISISGLPLSSGALEFLRQCPNLQKLSFEARSSKYLDDSETVAMLVAIAQLKLREIRIHAIVSTKQEKYEGIIKNVVGDRCVVKGRW